MKTKSKTRHAVASLSEFPPDSKKIVKVPAFGREIEIGVFNVGGKLVAYRNVCPHAGAPVCQGHVCGTTAPSQVGEYILARKNEILRCPWHGWEFDLLTGQHLVDEKLKLKSYDVESGEPEENLESFEVETEGEIVFVRA